MHFLRWTKDTGTSKDGLGKEDEEEAGIGSVSMMMYAGTVEYDNYDMRQSQILPKIMYSTNEMQRAEGVCEMGRAPFR